MALGAAIEWEVRTTGAATNGGGFQRGATGTDYSQQDSAQIAVTDLVTNGTTTVTSATAGFTSAHVGNVAYIAGGTGGITAGWYRVVSVTNSTTIVLDRSTGLTTGTGATFKLGGAMSNPMDISDVPDTGGNKVWVKAGTYVITSAFVLRGGAAGAHTVLSGYETTHGDWPTTRPVLQASGNINVVTYKTTSSSEREFTCRHIDFDGNGSTNTNGSIFNSTSSSATTWHFTRCRWRNWDAGSANWALAATINSVLWGCTFDNNGCIAVKNSDCYYCGFFDNDYEAMKPGGSGSTARAVGCVFARNGASAIVARTYQIQNCAFVDNAGSGIASDSDSSTAGGNYYIVNCIFYGNGAYGIALGTNIATCMQRVGQMLNNAYGANTSGAVGTATVSTEVGAITLTADPFTDKDNDDYSLNTASGGGALCADTGFPTTFPVT